MSFRFSSLLRRFRPNGVRGCANPVVKYWGSHHPVKYASSHALSKKSAPKNTEVKWASVKQDYHHHQHRNFKDHHYPFTLFAVSAGVLNPDDKDIKKDPKPKLVKSDANAVTIYVWLPYGTTIVENLLSSTVGHVALKTHAGGSTGEGYYMSLWPDKNNKAVIHKAYLSPSYDNDCALESYPGGPPRNADIIVTLHSLNVAAINAEFERISECSMLFGLGASVEQASVVTSLDTKADKVLVANCVKFIGHLLTVGEIRHLTDDSYYAFLNNYKIWFLNLACKMTGYVIPGCFYFIYKSFEHATVKPQDMANFVRLAKQVEEERFHCVVENNPQDAAPTFKSM